MWVHAPTLGFGIGGRDITRTLVDAEGCERKRFAAHSDPSHPVHYHEYHSGAISNELDDAVVERMKEEAAL